MWGENVWVRSGSIMGHVCHIWFCVKRLKGGNIKLGWWPRWLWTLSANAKRRAGYLHRWISHSETRCHSIIIILYWVKYKIGVTIYREDRQWISMGDKRKNGWCYLPPVWCRGWNPGTTLGPRSPLWSIAARCPTVHMFINKHINSRAARNNWSEGRVWSQNSNLNTNRRVNSTSRSPYVGPTNLI